ncbi:hypothetical protein DL95DRAFT_418292 [Leptodontidium sp. 2 PMI_412]|nr:hypothetical protein DL95DRAFT_418292 [Leptodontidium sp. 2 PMI_412]
MDTPDVKVNTQGRRRRKRENENINRRKETLVTKAFELGEFEGIEVALLICKNGQYTTYRSRGYASRQPSFGEIQTAYPLPKNLLPEDIEKRRRKRTRRGKLPKKKNQDGSWTVCEWIGDQESPRKEAKTANVDICK